MKRWAGTLLIGIAVLVGAYSNCSQVSLEKAPIGLKLEYASAATSLCLEGAYSNYTVDSITAYNLNLTYHGSEPDLDSDGDGISDKEEIERGLDPLNRRSNKVLLDSVCVNLAGSIDCDSAAVACLGQSNSLGLSDCDYKALGLDQIFAHPHDGIDSDKDGLPDLIEILRGTLPGQADHLDDPDRDLVRNAEEIAMGSNPRHFDSPFPAQFMVKTSTRKVVQQPDCSGEEWEFSLLSLPWLPAPAVTDDLESTVPSGGLIFTRPEGTNTGLIVLILHPHLGQTGNVKVLIRPFLLQENHQYIESTLADFVLAGEIQP